MKQAEATREEARQAERFSETAKQRALPGAWSILLRVTGSAMALFHLYTAATGPAIAQNAIHVLFALPIILLAYGRGPKDRAAPPWSEVILMVLAVTVSAYFIYHSHRIIYDLGYLYPTIPDLVLGVIAIGLLLEACRRSIGVAFPILVGIALAYALLGQYLPGRFGHGGFRWDDLIATFYLGPTGIYGSLMRISSTVIVIFVMFGALLVVTGGGDTFIRLSTAVAGRLSGGPAKAATLCSALFGSISGSTAANVATTGVFTIPLMKRNGYSPRFAAATESAASTGGQILPPIMGAAAFVMADVINTSYLIIIGAALIPALLFYLAIWMSVHFEAKRLGLAPVPASERPTIREGLRNSEVLFVPVIVLVIMLVMRYTPTTSALAAYVTAVLIYLLSWRSPGTLWQRIASLPAALEAGALTASLIAVIVGAVAIIAAVISITGLGLKVSSMILAISGGHVLLTLVLAMVVSIILGMGLPTVAAYMLTAAVVASAFVQADIPILAAHLFILYFAILSGVTPPVALAAYIGSAIAGSHWFYTALTASKIALGGFLIPYMFIYHPALLGQGSTMEIALAVVTGVIGVTALASSTIGYLLRPCRWWERAVLLAGAILLISGAFITDAVGIVLIGAVFLWQRYGPAAEATAKAAPQGGTEPH